MSGRAYTMKEMRGIVEYITAHSLYGEIKGRKMWMDFSSTGLTSRTWQSLKETFLKRILPDIYNPYYNLSMEQIRSFKTGADVTKKAAKLDIRKVSSSSNNVANEEPRPSTSKTNDSNKSTGEDGKKCLKIPSSRESLETVILDTEECYETAEDLIRELDSDMNAADDVEAMQPRRSLRDCITYAEPLTPLLQDIIHDFDSEDSEVDRPMEIDLNLFRNNNNKEEMPDKQDNPHTSFTANESISNNTEQKQKNLNRIQENGNEVLKNSQFTDSPKKKSLRLKKNQKVVNKKVSKRKLKKTSGEGSDKSNRASNEEEGATSVNNANPQSNSANRSSGEISETQNSINKPTLSDTNKVTQNGMPEKPSQNVTNSITDSLLPNNQEALDKKQEPEDSHPHTSISPNSLGVPKTSKKRSISTDLEDTKRKIKEKESEKIVNRKSSKESEFTVEVQVAAVVKPNEEKPVEDQQNTSRERHSSKENLESPKNPQENIAKEKDIESAKRDLSPQKNSREITKEANETISSFNPCLQSVSLFEEMLVAEDSDEASPSTSKENASKQKQTNVCINNNKVEKIITEAFIENEKANAANKKIEKEVTHTNALKLRKIKENGKEKWGVVTENAPKDVFTKDSEILVLRSYSESDSEERELKTKPKRTKLTRRPSTSKQQFNHVLDNLFGNSSGAGRGKRSKRNNFQNVPMLRQNIQSSDGEWTSESDSESSPARCHHRHCWKNIKPSSCKIKKHEGMLFAQIGNQVYPMVKNGKPLIYLRDGSDEDEAKDADYWKLKYIEMRKKYELNRNTSELTKDDDVVLPQDKPLPVPVIEKPMQILPRVTAEEEVTKLPPTVDEAPLKIKLSKHECQIEGNALSVQPFLSDFLKKMFSDQAKPRKEEQTRPAGVDMGLNSENTTPVIIDSDESIQNTRNKVDEMEKRILKETEELDKLDERTPKRKKRSMSVEETAGPKRLSERRQTSTSSDEHIPPEKKLRGQQTSNEIVDSILPRSKTGDPNKRQKSSIESEGEKAPEPKRLSKRRQTFTLPDEHIPPEKNSRGQQTSNEIGDSISPRSKTGDPNKRQKSSIESEGEKAPGPKRLYKRRQTFTSPDEHILPEKNSRGQQTSNEIGDSISPQSKTGDPNKIQKSSIESEGEKAPGPKRLSKRRQTFTSPDEHILPEKNSRDQQTFNEISDSLSLRSKTGDPVKRQKSSIESEVTYGNAKTPRTPTQRQRQKKKVFGTELNSFDGSKTDEDDEDSQILYKFPSPEPETPVPGRAKSRLGSRIIKASSSTGPEKRARSRSKSNLGQKLSNSKYGHKTPTIISKPNIELQSNESSQGYQESDISLVPINIRRKKRLSLQVTKARRSITKKQTLMKKRKHFYWDASGESSNSSFHSLPARNTAGQNSSQNTEEYRSESYQLLMPPPRNLRRLEIISETSPCPNEMNSAGDLRLSPASQNINETDQSETNSINIEIGHSSSVSLPLSPELSIVENVSIRKEMFQASAEYHPTINELQESAEMAKDCSSSYIISKLDISVPLMAQECNLKTYQKEMVNSDQSIENNHFLDSVNTNEENNSTFTKAVTVSESLLDKIDTVNIKNHTLSESLDLKLRNLLLESAKKIAKQNKRTEESMEHDGKDSIIRTEMQKNTKSKKRCSTPQKRKGTKKSQQLKIDVAIEEEHMEFCNSGRKSCPPVISVFCAEDSNKHYESIEDLNTTDKTIPNKKKGKRNKDIIKVKITRPKKTPTKKSNTKKSSKMSLLTDSGINDTISSAIQSFNESVDLIHNHSETCLHANECLSNSIEFVNKSKSIISVNSSIDSVKENISNNIRSTLSPEFFSNDAQDGSDKSYELSSSSNGEVPRSPVVLYAKPVPSVSSLLTEDLSDGSPKPRPSAWHLLSEDETTNTIDLKPAPCTVKPNTYLSNLKQLFPIACAVPDLSTITEKSEMDSNSKSIDRTNIDSNRKNAFLKKFDGVASSASPKY